MKEISELKLDLVDRKILTELDKNCRIPSTKLAKIVMKSRQAVDYRIAQLIEKGIITGFKTSINPHKIGNKIYKIYFKLKNIAKRREDLLNYLRKSDKVYWIGENAGRWDLIFGIFAKTDYEFFELKNKIISEFNDIIAENHGGIIVDVKQFPKMYLTKEKLEPTTFGGKVENNKLDRIDLRILSVIAGNARMPIIDIANKSKSTPAIAISRLKKLEKLGIIIQYRIEINTSKLNLENYKVIINLERYNKDDEKKLLQYISNRHEIQYLIRNIWQLEIELVVKNFQEYYKFVEDLKSEFPNIIKTIDFTLMIKDEWTTGFENLLVSN
ncbi:Lrp/AsnC family transcriptional regulator [Candidatus Pacearchaeota archaeon]|nr:Lrp/AsnC family transcriptional regulator [Candidatus Pacearchaeota archaeon]